MNGEFPLQVALLATLFLLSFLLFAKQTNKSSSSIHNLSRALITLNPRTTSPRVKSNIALRAHCLKANLVCWASPNALTILSSKITDAFPAPRRAVLAERGNHGKPTSPSNLPLNSMARSVLARPPIIRCGISDLGKVYVSRIRPLQRPRKFNHPSPSLPRRNQLPRRHVP